MWPPCDTWNYSQGDNVQRSVRLNASSPTAIPKPQHRQCWGARSKSGAGVGRSDSHTDNSEYDYKWENRIRSQWVWGKSHCSIQLHVQYQQGLKRLGGQNFLSENKTKPVLNWKLKMQGKDKGECFKGIRKPTSTASPKAITGKWEWQETVVI